MHTLSPVEEIQHTFRLDMQLLFRVNVTPHSLHIIPICNHTMLNGIFDLEQATMILIWIVKGSRIEDQQHKICKIKKQLVLLTAKPHEALLPYYYCF